MLKLSAWHQFIIGLLLITLMAMTRGHHFATLNHLPSASWAIFFLAGFYISSKFIFPILLGLAGLLDFAAITISGGSNYCATLAYAMLLPAYGTLWLTGRWYTSQYQFALKSLVPLVLSVTIAAAITTVFSSGGFYFFSGQYAQPSLIEFSQRFIKYYPRSLSNLAFYIGVVAIIHSYVSLTLGAKSTTSSSHS
ncbi:hypothetical protein N9Y67_02870 [Pseudomonadota bacterium]|nr:hypothetical protein [Pseudomonadota bacterium]